MHFATDHFSSPLRGEERTPAQFMEDQAMRANRVRDIWQSGGAVVNGWCGIPSGFSAEIMAHMGWDSLVVDTQHGIVGYETMVAMLQGISTTAGTPVVRGPWNSPAGIMRAPEPGA